MTKLNPRHIKIIRDDPLTREHPYILSPWSGLIFERARKVNGATYFRYKNYRRIDPWISIVPRTIYLLFRDVAAGTSISVSDYKWPKGGLVEHIFASILLA